VDVVEKEGVRAHELNDVAAEARRIAQPLEHRVGDSRALRCMFFDPRMRLGEVVEKGAEPHFESLRRSLHHGENVLVERLSLPCDSRRAIAMTVKSRRSRSSFTDADASTTISKSWRRGPVHCSRRGGANSIPAGTRLRISRSRGRSRSPTLWPATSRSSTRPC